MMRGVFRFEDIGDELPLLPLAARRALDAVGRRLSLAAWQKLPMEQRRRIVAGGSSHEVDGEGVLTAIESAEPAAEPMPAADEEELDELPMGMKMSVARWRELSRLERFALRHLVQRDKRDLLAQALAEIAPDKPTHLDERGDARMVDVGEKPVTHRRAVARARVRMRSETAHLVADEGAPKGDVIAAARIAGIMGAKRTSELIPLCHPIALDRVAVAIEVDASAGLIEIHATADAHDKTGVEMEAMTAATVAALTIYDMLKGVERGIAIEEVVLVEKLGGRSGHYKRSGA
jgi:cyclic pyranopterin phosphate synthase